MADVVVRRIEDLPRQQIKDAEMVFARAGLGVTSFGLQVERLPPGFSFEHDEADSGQEEVYVVLEGSITLRVDHDEFLLEPGVMARIGPQEWREIRAGESGALVLCVGGVPGEAFKPGGWSDGVSN
jgi:mannose-6-phosphate isomerase-like protein (cupin superfamily)